ncbi:hypothetical protein [Niabella aurantiaca]|uniref:hypothetical protein n=1 Tax=Niabella aurantiaca TaxID=379900 RepID=UPI00036EF330|nr:hypothetical protein [Niabella aurantiaca]
MALEKNNNAVFLSISDGKITRRVKQSTQSSVTRVTKNGHTIHEEIYDSVSGIITDIKPYTHDQYGKFWNVRIEDGGDAYVLQMNYSGGYSSAFLKQLPNVDLNERVRFIPSMKEVDGKKRVTLFLNQNGQALKHYYTKDDPKGLPNMVQVKVKGQLTWDDSDMMEFLENMVNTEVLPKLKKSDPVTAGSAEESDEAPF